MQKLVISAFIALSIGSAAQAVTITGFGTGQFTTTFSEFASTTQSATGLSINGTVANQLFGSFAPINIGSVSTIYLTATESSNISSAFGIEIFDADGDSVTYSGSWGSFPAGVSTTVALTQVGSVGTFNGIATNLGFLPGSINSDTLTVVLDDLSTTAPIPEPSSFAALAGFAALGLVGLRRRRR